MDNFSELLIGQLALVMEDFCNACFGATDPTGEIVQFLVPLWTIAVAVALEEWALGKVAMASDLHAIRSSDNSTVYIERDTIKRNNGKSLSATRANRLSGPCGTTRLIS